MVLVVQEMFRLDELTNMPCQTNAEESDIPTDSGYYGVLLTQFFDNIYDAETRK